MVTNDDAALTLPKRRLLGKTWSWNQCQHVAGSAAAPRGRAVRGLRGVPCAWCGHTAHSRSHDLVPVRAILV